MEYVQLEGIHIHEDGYAKFIELTLFYYQLIVLLNYHSFYVYDLLMYGKVAFEINAQQNVKCQK